MSERTKYWAGWVLSGLASAALLMSASMKFSGSPQFTEFFVDKFGYPIWALTLVGALEIGCTLIYLFPATSVFGAVLLTAFLGGAVATHVRVSDPPFGPIVIGILVWIGLYLREPRLRALVPFKSSV